MKEKKEYTHFKDSVAYFQNDVLLQNGKVAQMWRPVVRRKIKVLNCLTSLLKRNRLVFFENKPEALPLLVKKLESASHAWTFRIGTPGAW